MISPDPIGLLALCGALAIVVFLPRISKHKRRADQLWQAVELLKLHNEAIDRFAATESVDSGLRRQVLDICDTLSEKEMVCSIADEFLNEDSKYKKLMMPDLKLL